MSTAPFSQDASAPPDLDFVEEEDLFQFDALLQEAQSARAEARARRSAPAREPQPDERPEFDAKLLDSEEVEVLGRRRSDAYGARHSPADGREPGTDAGPRVARPSIDLLRALKQRVSASPTWLVWTAVALVNLGGIGFVLHSQHEVESLAQGLELKLERATSELVAVSSDARAKAAPLAAAVRTEGDECLESAAAALERGEFEAARRSLYALLAIADRLEASARHDVEARASFLIADSYRLQADALQGGSK